MNVILEYHPFADFVAWVATNGNIISIFIDIIATIATTAAVIVAIKSNKQANKSLQLSLKMQEQSKNVDLYDRRIGYLSKFQECKNVSEDEIQILFNTTILESYKKLMDFQSKAFHCSCNKTRAIKYAQEFIDSQNLNEDFQSRVREFEKIIDSGNCSNEVITQFAEYCEKYERIKSYTDDYTIVYNYYTLSEEETTYNNLFNQEKEKLIELTKTFIKKSIEPIEK